jgi:hypothetical protein
MSLPYHQMLEEFSDSSIDQSQMPFFKNGYGGTEYWGESLEIE